MNNKLSKDSRISLIERSLQGESVVSLCKEVGISRQLFYRWLKKYNSTGKSGLELGKPGRPRIRISGNRKPVYNVLSPKAKDLMLREVVKQGAKASDVSKRYGISRVTFYKWLSRYKNAANPDTRMEALQAKRPVIDRYFHQTPEKYEQAILAMVAKHPEFGIRSIIANLPKIGSLPIVGHHGVQNVLRRNDLLTYSKRLVYAQDQNTGLVVTIDKILAPVFSFFRLSRELRSKLVKYSGTIAFSAFTLVVAFGIIGIFANNVIFSSAGSKVGLTFAFISLGMGSILFLYSLKYYLTLAVVLSFSQDPKQHNKAVGKEGGILNWILGMSHPGEKLLGRGNSGAGLESDLSGVKLNRKPFISVQIPFYNEKNVVERAIRASTSFKYDGEYEVILCDDSTDETGDIIRRYQKDCLFKYEKLKETHGDGWTMTEVEVKPGLVLKHIHRTSRDGYKGKALDLALKLSNPKTEFVAIFDADFVPYPDSLDLFLKYFKAENNMSEDYKKSKVAAVQGYQWHVLNKSENWITRGVRGEYAGSYVVERSGAEIYGGLKQISGSVYMIRRDILAEIGWGTSITEDFELTLRLYEKGYKVLYTPYIQAPAECVSTVKRLVRQRMRWAEGHSFNIKKMFKKLFLSPNLTFAEKAELLYLAPYYLQAFFFLVGTVAWLLSETVFKVRLPFWSELWGWSLVLTNMIALPLLNMVGLFVEESEQRDYLGILSFLALSYLLVPFQAYAAVKGLMETDEGPWFRTPKTGRITDIFSRGKFYKFIAGILPGNQSNSMESEAPSPYLSLSTANNKFDEFKIMPKKSKFVGYAGSFLTVVLSLVSIYQSQKVDVGKLVEYPIMTSVEVESRPFDFVKTFTDVFMPQDVLSRGFDLQMGSGHNFRIEYAGIIATLVLVILLIVILEVINKNRKRVRKLVKVGFVYLILLSVSLSNVLSIFISAPKIKQIAKESGAEVPDAKAIYQYSPTSSNLITGTTATIDSSTATSAEGMNSGGWQGTLADDNIHWVVNGANAAAADNYNVQLNLDGVNLNGANKIIIQTAVDLDAAIAMKVQICDWVSSTSVDSAADSQCTTGGWRSLNSKNTSNANVNLTTTTNDTALQWHIYDGYFTTGTTGGTAVSTSLSNFVSNDSNKRVKIRYYSVTQSSTAIAIDYLRIMPIVDSVYHPAGFTKITGGTPTGTYTNADVIGNTTTAQQSVTASDNNRLGVPGTAGSISDFYFSFFNVNTYTGANALYVKAEYNCSTTGINIKPKVYNFNSSSWEDLTSTAIACSATDATNAWAKGNITLSNYISNGEMRVGWYGSGNSTVAIQIDFEYLMIGSVNSDSAQCEVSFGTGTASNCVNTRDLDGTTTIAAGAVFQNPAEDESTTFSHSFYARDNDQDATLEEAAASEINVPVTVPSNAQVVGINYASRASGCGASASLSAACGATAMTVQPGLRDYTGMTSVVGGWTQVGAATGNVTLGSTTGYTDTITSLSATLPLGVVTNPSSYIDTNNNLMNVRLATTASGTSTTNVTANWDFVMTSIAWVNEPSNFHPSARYMFTPTSQNLVTGSDTTITSGAAAAAGGINMGSWKGTLADDNLHWSVLGANAASATNYDVQLNLDSVQLNGANKMIIQTEVDVDAAIVLLVQVCDWVSTTSVDSAADSQCTGGGWRTVNTQNASNANVNLTTVTTPAGLQWHIYDGYFTTGTTGGTAVSTPLTNFVSNDSNHRVKIRYFSTVQSATAIDIDYLRVIPVVDSIYHPAGFTQITGGTPAGTYVNADVIGNSTTAQLSTTAGDNVRLAVPGTAGAISDFYLSYKNIETYTGMNTIYVKAEYNCSTTGINIKPKIYNFNSSSWEDLTSTAIACSATDATNAWALNNVTIANYISNGELRVGWYGSANNTLSIQLDLMYVMLGTTNSDSALCEASFGTGTATNCSNTRTLDGTTTIAAGAVFQNPAEDESTTFGHAFYARDNDQDGTLEEAAASEVTFSVTAPADAMIVGLNYASRSSGCGASASLSAACGATAMTVQPGLKDYSGLTSTVGGWTQVGAGTGSVTLGSTTGYTDTMTALAVTLPMGLITNAEDYVDTVDNQINMRLTTTASGTSTTNVTANWDFAMVSMSWIYPTPQYEQSDYRLFANLDQSPPDVGSALAGQNTSATTPSQGTAFRLRILLRNYGQDEPLSGENFKVQIAERGADNLCDTSFTNETYADLSPSSGAVRFYDNSSLSDGANITSDNANDPVNSLYTNTRQTYEESNNFTNSQNIIRTDNTGRWDFAMVDFSAATNTTYCVRVVKSDTTPLDTYTVIPQFTTVPENPMILLVLTPFLLGFMKKKKKRS